ncbi:DUF4229 domain-containing protein [Microbacterium sp.]|uniref:DUF4229 domain-containing protein n=1 Tax=Microbacterium sp. TaxID=51671 RepID=UPI0039E3B982
MRARPALVYSVLRLLAFFVPFGIMMLFPVMREFSWLSAIFAALIGLSLSVLFLRRPLDEVTSALAARRAGAAPSGARADADAEDAVADAASAASASSEED